MKQLTLITEPEENTKYLVKYRGQEREAWFMGGKFNFNNYFQIENAEIIERIGKPEEIFK